MPIYHMRPYASETEWSIKPENERRWRCSLWNQRETADFRNAVVFASPPIFFLLPPVKQAFARATRPILADRKSKVLLCMVLHIDVYDLITRRNAVAEIREWNLTESRHLAAVSLYRLINLRKTRLVIGKMAAEMLNKNRLMVFKNKGKDQDVSTMCHISISFESTEIRALRVKWRYFSPRIGEKIIRNFRDDASFRIMNHLGNVAPSAFPLFPAIAGMSWQNVIIAGHLQVTLTGFPTLSKISGKNVLEPSTRDFTKVVSTTFFFLQR